MGRRCYHEYSMREGWNNYGKGSEGLYKYIKESYFLSYTEQTMNSKTIVKESVLEVVKQVLVEGKSTLPK